MEATAPGFDEPLRMLSDCHRRIERFLAELLDLAGRPPGHPLSPADEDRLRRALRYFTGMMRKHTVDEEQSLFPRLRAAARRSNDAAASALLPLLDRLEADHTMVALSHAEVEQLARGWLEGKAMPAAEQRRLCGLVQRLSAAYAAHISLEDDQVFPAAAHLLDGPTLTALGAEMSARRQHLTCSQRKTAAETDSAGG